MEEASQHKGMVGKRLRPKEFTKSYAEMSESDEDQPNSTMLGWTPTEVYKGMSVGRLETKILKTGQPGPAYRYMVTSPLKETHERILSSVGEVQKGKLANLTLVLAIQGGGDVHQCKTCNKYFKTRESALRHTRAGSDCTKSEY